jgi:hypothetical protein
MDIVWLWVFRTSRTISVPFVFGDYLLHLESLKSSVLGLTRGTRCVSV